MAYAESGSAEVAGSLQDVLTFVRRQTGIDFELYRASTIERRTLGRMRLAGDPDFAAYLARLAEDPVELERLIGYLTIKVGRFLRDPQVFAVLRDRVLPELRRRRPDAALHLWSAGCGYGEEPYSLALLLAEGGDAYAGARVLATDLDRGALAQALAGHYRGDALADLAPETVEAYFSVEESAKGRSYTVVDRLRAYTEFRWHNLAGADASPDGQHFDLICCRNVLIYFCPELQRRVEQLLCGSLAPGGYLCLGEADWPLPGVVEAFTVFDRQARILQLKDDWREQLAIAPSQRRL